jgi:DNA-binding HxlR family transcriptional regulator/putative sterol carrier protein
MRGYRQFCPAARALDVVGERWTLLVIRELLFGPKRYTDLQEGLPGIGPNVLAARLRSLTAAGLIEQRRLPPPAASTVYELTDLGAGLRPVLLSLFQWGLQLLDAPCADDVVRASYWIPAIEAAAYPERAPKGTDDIYEFRIGEEAITVLMKAGVITVRQGAAESPDLVIRTDASTFVKLGRGTTTAAEAARTGALTFEGDPGAAERCAAIFAVQDSTADSPREFGVARQGF